MHCLAGLDQVTSGRVMLGDSDLTAMSDSELTVTVVMVTHDPAAAADADRVVWLADGRMVGEITEPTAASVLDGLSRLGT